ncbi:hypothetical protein [Phycicoccus sp. HDW14]|uniref:hypothetical protein n=1 Tax=Phycicoccus sp. HDW14 TaxID=2714941 RepID=UPI001F0FF26C|nr:hypothetical protein [Phycicoccus sp. HDW14]
MGARRLGRLRARPTRRAARLPQRGRRRRDAPALRPGAPREPYFEGLAAGTDEWSRERYDEFMAAHDNHWVDEG